MKKSLPDPGLELPIAFVPCSNGEYAPAAPTERDRKAIEIFARAAEENAKHTGVSRRDFVRSACGLATALGVMNLVYGCQREGDGNGLGGGWPSYDVDRDAMLDPARACEKLGGDEFVFDVQTHHVDPSGAWRAKDPNAAIAIGTFPQAACGEDDRLTCLGTKRFIREIFVKSDTAVACLTGLPSAPEVDSLPMEARAATRRIVERLSGSPRLLIHANVRPEVGPRELDAMSLAHERYANAGWKVYPGVAWRFDDEKIAVPFLERARAIGVKVVCAHRGIQNDTALYGDLSSPREMIKMAKQYPDLSMLVYHSGFEGAITEGPYDPVNPRGIDRMVKGLEEFPTDNVYAELGATFRALMTRPLELAHALGKLLKSVGEDRILWGTDCIWFGSPAEQLAAFRAFQIPEELQEKHGYPALTPAIKAKILGLNAAKVYGVDPGAVRCAIEDDDIAKIKEAKIDDGWPLGGYGPKTRRELFEMFRRG
ncbi:MAG: amidohydrolase family protein [Labilithrix sp.]|nr:amidohydrolase family protein [Labilithrix sp.]